MSGITESGFQRKTLQQLITSLNSRLVSKLGLWNQSANSVEAQFVSVFAEELDQTWQGIEGVYSSQTYSGSEAVYLDDIISQQGVFRKGKSKGSGEVVVFANLPTTSTNYLITSGRSVSGTNGITYTTSTEKAVNSLMSCYRLKASTITQGVTYVFTMYNVEDVSANTFTWTAGSSDNIDEMLVALSQFANANITKLEQAAYYNFTDRTLYIGFNRDVNNNPLPLSKANLSVTTSPAIGEAGYRLACTANTAGFFPLNVGEASGLSPSFTGFIESVNWQTFSSGSDVQTDAQYRALYENLDSVSLSGTPAKIKSSVLGVAGVIDAEIFQNPTKDFLYDLNNNIVCEPYTYNVVVLGGEEEDVARAIGGDAPVNVKQYGTTQISYTDEADNVIEVEFTKATYFNYAVNVTYETKDGTYLTDVEKADVGQLMLDLTNEIDIGGTIPLEQVKASVYRAISFKRLKTAYIQIKDLTNAGGQFITSDLIPKFSQKPQLLYVNITFNRA
jgi:uncharacterized phage protein gp47/JayE